MTKKLFIAALSLLGAFLLLGSCGPKNDGKQPIDHRGDYSIKIFSNSQEVYEQTVKLGSKAVRIEALLQKNDADTDENVKFTWTASDPKLVLLSSTGASNNVLFIEAINKGRVEIVCKTTIEGKEVSSKPFVLNISDDPLLEGVTFTVDAEPGSKYTIRLGAKSGKALIYHGNNRVDEVTITSDSFHNEPTPVEIEIGESKSVRIISGGFFQLWTEGVPITNIDVSHASNLLYLYILSGKLTSFDATALRMVKELYLNDNQINNIVFSDENLDLKYLELDDNQLDENGFHIPDKVAGVVEVLYLSRNNFTTFDYTRFPKLHEFKMSANKLKGKLSFEGMEWLWKIYVAENELTSINVTGLEFLNYFRIQDNQITEIITDDYECFQQVMIQNNNFPEGYLDKICANFRDYNYNKPDGTIDQEMKLWAENTIFRAWGNKYPPSDATYDALEAKYWNVERFSPQSAPSYVLDKN